MIILDMHVYILRNFFFDFSNTFLNFQCMVGNQFGSKLRIFQCDGGGEFELKEFLSHLEKMVLYDMSLV
jgi:hypothetical protein